MLKSLPVPLALVASVAFLQATEAQSVDPSLGRHLAETVCNACHQVGTAPPQNAQSGAPSFAAISHMRSMTETAIKVFLRTSHRTMPNIILSREEVDSVAAYIATLSKE